MQMPQSGHYGGTSLEFFHYPGARRTVTCYCLVGKTIAPFVGTRRPAKLWAISLLSPIGRSRQDGIPTTPISSRPRLSTASCPCRLCKTQIQEQPKKTAKVKRSMARTFFPKHKHNHRLPPLRWLRHPNGWRDRPARRSGLEAGS